MTNRIAVTAKLAAYYRQFSDIAFTRQAAALIGADEAFHALVREHGLDPAQLTFYAPMFEARYKAISALIRASGARQVLELASGYSLRGFDLTREPALRYVETDLADVVGAKRALLEQLGEPSHVNHTVAIADALSFDELAAATRNLARAEPLVVLCEGLLLYLSRAQIEQVTANVRRLLGEFAGGTWLTPDFAFQSEAQNVSAERKRMREVVTGMTQTQFDEAAFADPEALSTFLRDAGFEVEVRSQIDEAGPLSSTQALGLAPALVERLRPVLRVWRMSAP